MRYICSLMAKMYSTLKPRAKPKVLVLAGSTSVGKTDLSLELASLLHGEVVSADSAQVFRGMDIGSAKIRRDEMRGIPHHLIDVVDMTQSFSAGQYAQQTEGIIEDILSRGHVPMVVGGSGLYFRTLMEGPSNAPQSTPATKAMVEDMLQSDKEWESSIERLRVLDQDYADTLKPNDWYRLKRALEICTLSGRTVTSFKREYSEEESKYLYKCLFLTMPRVPLKQRIDTRCELIVEQGLFTEVIGLARDHGLVTDCQAGRSVGYRQALEFLASAWGFPSQGPPYQLQVSRDDLRELFLQFLYSYQAKTRQLATAQTTWIKKAPHFHWLNMAPDGKRLSVDIVAKGIAEWFYKDTPLPSEWSGEGLKDASSEEREELKRYGSKHVQLGVYSDPAKVDALLHQIETCIQTSGT